MPRRTPGLVLADLPEGEVVAQAAGGATAIILDPVAGAVVELCDGRRTVPEIAAFLCETLPGTDRSQVENDVARLVGELLVAGVLEEAG